MVTSLAVAKAECECTGKCHRIFIVMSSLLVLAYYAAQQHVREANLN